MEATPDLLGCCLAKPGAWRDEADEWIRRYPQDASVSAYIGRHGWNVLRVGGRIPADEIREAMEESYDRVVSGLPRSRRPA
ncbi:hypothetical protein GGG17_00885 [Arsenicicoccus sp. MKL-02]|uniref:Uncharacterized protein n=1 Tax=Arsenicicoccus cauae TaxID=2663847 RepID=A0A6I3ID18_9MICO|nr:hypothetical protein [Arsenicicoccus cauae]MTB70553.1 hypothetical protein [Arsenicicoccus cauae]